MYVTKAVYRIVSAISDLSYPTPFQSRQVLVTSEGMMAAAYPFWRRVSDAEAVWPVPDLVSYDPAGGFAGDTITLTGTRFTSDCAVNFVGTNGGSTMAADDVVVVNDTTITCKIPEGAGATIGTPEVGPPLGPRISVTNEAGSDLLTTPRVDISVPHIDNLNPTTAEEEAEVVATGTNFVDVQSVFIGAVEVTVYTVDSSTQITFEVPAGAETGDLLVTTLTGEDLDPPELEVGAGTLDLNFTEGIPDDVLVTRTGDAILAATSEGVLDTIAADTPVWEDRGNGQAGLWAFGPYENLIPDPFDFQAANWSGNGSHTVASATGPDGTSRAQRVNDTDGAGFGARFYSGASGTAKERVASVWTKDGSPAPSKSGGVNFHVSYSDPISRHVVAGSIWRHTSILDGDGAPVLRLYTAGLDPWQLDGGDDNSVTGATDWFGAQITEDSAFCYPLIDGSTGEQKVSLDTPLLDGVIIDGDFDLRLQLITWLQGEMRPANASDSTGDCFVFKAATPDGELSLRFIASTEVFQLKVRGSDVAGAAVGFPTWGYGKTLEFRVTYQPSTGDWRLRVEVQGVISGSSTLPTEIYGSTTGGALAAPTAFHIASDGAGGGHLPCQVRRLQTFAGATIAKKVCKILWLGDSISAIHTDDSCHPMACSVLSIAEADVGIGIVDLSVPGATIATATDNFDTSNYVGDTDVELAVIHLGTNDRVTFSASAATIEDDLEELATYLKANLPNAQVLLVMPPPHGTDSEWAAVRTWMIAGGITDVDLTSVRGYDALNDGASNIGLHYKFDTVHPNQVGRNVYACGIDLVPGSPGGIRQDIETLGVLP